MAYQTLRIEIKDKIARIILNRPDKKNAMNPRLHKEMTEALEKLRYDDAAAVVVITGAGNSFCAGMDLKEFFQDLKVKKPKEFDRYYRMATDWRGRTLRYFPKPTIAMVNGFCFGGAFSIVEGCDLAVAADEATFGLSEINFRLFPGGSVSKSLANLMRPRDALYYGLSGRPFNGKEAARIGFVNFSVPLARLEKDGTIVGYTVKLKPQDEDQRIRALMTVAVEGNRTDEVLRALRGDPAVCALHTTNGRWDIVAELRTDSLEAVDKVLSRIRLIDGISNTETSLLLSTHKF